VKVNGTLLKSIYSHDVEDAVFALMALQNGISGVLSINWSDETYRKMSTSLTVIGKKGKIICDATEIKIYLKEENKREHLEKGWTIRSIAEYAIPVNYYLRGEEYSAQIDNFIDCIKSGKQSTINTFEQAQYTDRVIEMILSEAKRA
jgi:predicted dehydrogenase